MSSGEVGQCCFPIEKVPRLWVGIINGSAIELDSGGLLVIP